MTILPLALEKVVEEAVLFAEQSQKVAQEEGLLRRPERDQVGARVGADRTTVAVRVDKVSGESDEADEDELQRRQRRERRRGSSHDGHSSGCPTGVQRGWSVGQERDIDARALGELSECEQRRRKRTATQEPKQPTQERVATAMGEQLEA